MKVHLPRGPGSFTAWVRPCFVACLIGSASLAEVLAFEFNDVVALARERAESRYASPEQKLPAVLRELSFLEYRTIKQNQDAWLWHDTASPFRVELAHVGMQFSVPVRVHVVDAGEARSIAYDPETFDFGDIDFDPEQLPDSGIAGFRLRYPIHEAARPHDELATFLGGSFFRALGANQVYGTYARGLAVDTGTSSGEKFPWFQEFWFVQPEAEARELTMYALLDAPSVAGAYRFVVRPDDVTQIEVEAHLFFRQSVEKLGIAPLTSMYLHGANQPPSTPTFRPQLHDADGLAIALTDREWLWRPLNNPRRLAMSAFRVNHPLGYGLMQRSREFKRFEDLDARYDLRPSVWVEPLGDWGDGSIELLEIPSRDETNGNIVAFWTPQDKPQAGDELTVRYRLHWTRHDVVMLPESLAWVAQTRRLPYQGNGERAPNRMVFGVDFVGPSVNLASGDKLPEAVVDGNGGVEVLRYELVPHPVNQGLRLVIELRTLDRSTPAELQAQLLRDGQPISERWTYRIVHD